MKLLLVAATKEEPSPLFEKYSLSLDENNHCSFQTKTNQIEILITGVGMVATTFHLTKFLSGNHSFNSAINIGIAGSFTEEIKIGEVVSVTEECFADLGAEDGEEFISITELGFQKENEFPFVKGKLLNSSQVESKLRKVKGVTVNTSHGNESSIKKVKEKFNAEVESMEGAAFVYCCSQFKIEWNEVRSISNFIERRDRSKWNIPLAVKNLNEWLINFIESE